MVNIKKKKSIKKSKSKSKCSKDMTLIDIEDITYCVGKCPHAGGQIVYRKDLKKFKCTRHGSEFSLNGIVDEKTGPAKKIHGKLKVTKI